MSQASNDFAGLYGRYLSLDNRITGLESQILQMQSQMDRIERLVNQTSGGSSNASRVPVNATSPSGGLLGGG